MTRRRSLSCAVILILLMVFLPLSGAAAATRGGCAQSLTTGACSQSGRIAVSGTSGSPGQSGDDQRSTSSILDIDCDADTTARLVAAGDPDAQKDALTCLYTDPCQTPGGYPRGTGVIKVVVLRTAANGSAAFVDTDCVITTPTRPQVTAALVRDRVVRLIPGAVVGLAPHGATLVNIETVMWVDAGDHQTLAPIEILGRRVVVSLSLDHVVWRFGDGESDTTSSPGKAYAEQADPCTTRECSDYYGHTYDRPGRVRVNAAASWSARFTVDGGAPITIPGTVAGPTEQAAIVVKQARGVLVQNPGGH